VTERRKKDASWPKKVSDHPALVSFEDLVQRNSFKRRIVVKLMSDRELCLPCPTKVFGEKNYIFPIGNNFLSKMMEFLEKEGSCQILQPLQ
jgi:hypothetical protein